MPPEDVQQLRWLLSELNPAAKVELAVKGAIDPSLLFDIGATEIVAAGKDAQAWLAADAYATGGHAHECAGAGCDHPHHHHGAGGSGAHSHEHLHGIRSFALTFDHPLDAEKLEAIIGAMQMVYGSKILRMKGIVGVAGAEVPFVIHGVSGSFYPVEQLPAWPSADRRSRIVFITKDLDESAVRTVFGPII